MPTDNRVRKRASFRLPMLVLGVVMTLIYVVLGAMLLLNKSFLPYIESNLRNIFAVLLLIYGIYRGWRVYADHLKPTP
jgi:uncharacterized membrane protein HdeD (DUF308 family)